MKKIALLFAFSLLIFGYTNAQNVATEAQVENPNAPEIAFDKIVHDYGTVYYGGDGNCEFKFTNKGKEPLILSNVRSSCGCTVPQWPRTPILPGGSDVIKVKYDTKRKGSINKSITVQSNAKTSNVVLQIKGNIIDDPKDNTMPENNSNEMAPKTN